MRIVALLIPLALLAGCVSLTPQQQSKVDELQRFADRTTAVYGLPRVRISIQPPSTLNVGATYRQGNILVNVQMLDSPSLTKLIAHELGHYLQGPAPIPTSMAEWQRNQEQRELDANAKAVEILVRAHGMTEREAVGVVVEALRRAQRAIERGAPLTPGHLPPAAEIADLLARFPASRP